jgi:ribose transport system substrate-binding protein
MNMLRDVFRRPRVGRLSLLAVVGAAALAYPVASSVAASDSSTHAAADKPVIALSNSFLGNSWRQTMVKIFEQTAKQAKAQGLISD